MRAASKGLAIPGVPLGILVGVVLLGVAAGGRRSAADAPGSPAHPALKLPGRVEAFAQARLYARVGGTVQSWQADIGDRVKKGQVLAQVSAPELEAELKQKAALVAMAEAEDEQGRGGVQVAEAALAQARAGVAEAEAAVKSAAADLKFRQAEAERMKVLFQQKAVDQQVLAEQLHQVNGAEAALKQAEAKVEMARAAAQVAEAKRARAAAGSRVVKARVEVARADLQRVQVLLQDATVQAPFDGEVIRRDVNVGDVVAPPNTGGTDPLFVVGRTDPVRVVVAVPEQDATRVVAGIPAVVRVPVLNGRELAGKVTRTAGALDPNAHTLRAEIELANPEGKLLPGMTVTVALTPESRPGRTGPPERPRDDPAPKPAAADAADVKALARARREAAEKVYGALLKQRQLGLAGADAEQFYLWSRRWLEAQRDASGTKEERLAALEAHLQRMTDVQKVAAQLAKAGQAPTWQGAAADFYRTEAELWLAQEKAR
jgi:multidrug efflux pump subunit AcrA (membrane-fusion protein)